MHGASFFRVAAAMLAAFAVGLMVQPATRAVARSTTYEKLGVFTRVLTYVQNNYVEDVDATHLLYGAIKGMLSTLDPHSAFMTPEEYEEMKIDTGGEFGGIGLEVTRDGDRLVVVAPIDDTPAARAGLRPADVIVSIDGADASGLSLPDAVRLMRGAPGSNVVLKIDRSGFSEPRDISIRRDHIRINPVSVRAIEGGYGVVRIKSFQDRTDRYLRQALTSLKEENGGEIKGLVLDLRNNPGGLLDQAVNVANTWLQDGVIVTTRGRGTHREVQRAHRAGTEPAYPLVVLINGGSASASEIVAGALQDHGRGVLMGTTTFGKGSVQTVIDLDDGSGLKLTIARYYTPSGRAIGDDGIEPDVKVEALERRERRAEDERDEAPEDSLASDNQLKTALDALRTWQIIKAGERGGGSRAEARP
jgi:carboxyl-terminal processing protease